MDGSKSLGGVKDRLRPLFIGVTPLTSKNGNVLGFLRDISPYRKAIFDRKGALLGWYNSVINQTFNSSGKPISNKGDLRAFLLSKSR